MDHHALAVDVRNTKSGDLRDSQAARVGNHENGAVLGILDGGEEAADLLGAEHDWQSARRPGEGNPRDVPVLAEGGAVEKTARPST